MRKFFNIAVLILFTFLLSAFLTLIFYLINSINLPITYRYSLIIFGRVLVAAVVSLGSFGLFYNIIWSFKDRSVYKIFFLFSGFLIVWISLFIFSGSILKINSEVIRLYDYLTSDNIYPRWEGSVHQSDLLLGYAPRPGSSGKMVKRYLGKTPVRFSEEGFRISASEDSDKLIDPLKKSILFLGCSFTFGDACRAEDTFAQITADSLGMNCLNAGVCGYGLAQMVIYAERLIPMYRPEYVVIQYSPWLTDRSLKLTAPSYIGMIPNPFFTCWSDYKIQLEYPVFRTDVFDIDKDKFRKKYSDSFLSYYLKTGIIYGIKEYLRTIIVNINSFRICGDRVSAEYYGYSRIIHKAEEYGAIPVILPIGDLKNSLFADTLFNKFHDVLTVDTYSALKTSLETSRSKKFSIEYNQWIFRNDSLIVIDEHPNPKAHFVIAASLLSSIKSSFYYQDNEK